MRVLYNNFRFKETGKCYKMNLKHLKNLNVLYVEDDENIAKPTSDLLKNFFNKIYHINNAEDAISCLNEELIHLLITDIELPGMSGLTLCEKIRETDQSLPIFITTIHDDNDTLKKAIKLNLVDFLVKPISVKSIIDALTQTLKKFENNGDFTVKISDSVQFYPFSGELKVSDKSISLTQYELTLLSFLVKHKNQIISRSTIEDILKHEETITDAAYKNLIYRLRKKIGKNSLQTVIGVGIKLNV